MNKINVYFAAPLFSEAEANYNFHVMHHIREAIRLNKQQEVFDFFVPQEQEINDKSTYADSKMIAQLDRDAVAKSDILIAVLDGPVIDPGVAAEIGIAHALGITVFGLYTDIRQKGADNQKKLTALHSVAENQFHYVNLFVTGLIKLSEDNGSKIYTSVKDLAEGVVEFGKWWTEKTDEDEEEYYEEPNKKEKIKGSPTIDDLVALLESEWLDMSDYRVKEPKKITFEHDGTVWELKEDDNGDIDIRISLKGSGDIVMEMNVPLESLGDYSIKRFVDELKKNLEEGDGFGGMF